MVRIALIIIILVSVSGVMVPLGITYADDQSASQSSDEAINNSKQASEEGTEGADFVVKTLESRLNIMKRDAGELTRRAVRADRKNALVAGGLVLSIVGLGLLDDEIQRSFQKNRTGSLDDIAQGFDFLGSTPGTLITNFSLVGIGWLNKEYKGGRKLYRTAGISLEAQTFAGIITWALKFSLGRARPHEGKGTSSFKPFHSFNTSFPSGHTSQAWAMATVFANHYDPPIPLIAYTYATLMGLSRIYQDHHFASDVLAGAAIGYFIGKSLSRIHKDFDSRIVITPFVLTSKRGSGIAFNYKF